MVEKTERERALALAGVFQAADLVQKVATDQPLDRAALETTLGSLIQIDPPNVDAVYGGADGVRRGVELVLQQVGTGGKETRNLELTRYVVALLHLERRLMKRSDLLERLTQGIEKARSQTEYFGSVGHENVVANLADTYVETISTLSPRIMVSGTPTVLAEERNANLIRALLLAGIRSAVLWSQCGGSRWKLLFGRSALLREAERLAGGWG